MKKDALMEMSARCTLLGRQVDQSLNGAHQILTLYPKTALVVSVSPCTSFSERTAMPPFCPFLSERGNQNNNPQNVKEPQPAHRHNTKEKKERDTVDKKAKKVRPIVECLRLLSSVEIVVRYMSSHTTLT
jgi:hypothetical protein